MVDQQTMDRQEVLARALISAAHEFRLAFADTNKALYHLIRALDKEKPPMRRPQPGKGHQARREAERDEVGNQMPSAGK
jgi:hypothetical protein